MTAAKKRYHRPHLRQCAQVQQGTEATIYGPFSPDGGTWPLLWATTISY